MVGAAASVLIMSLARAESHVFALTPLIGLVIGMLSGCFWPLSIVGDDGRLVGHLLPTAWAVDAIGDISSGGQGLGQVWSDLLVVWIYGLVLLAVAAALYRRSLARA